MQISNRAKATLGLAGAAVVAGVALSGGGPHLDLTASSSAAPRTATGTVLPSSTPTWAAAQAGLGAAGSPAPAAAAAPASSPTSGPTWGSDPGRIVLVLDSSRSMRTAANGTTRMEEAKKALSGVVASLPDTAQVGLRVYGSSVSVGDPLRPSEAACRDSRQVLPIAPVDRTKLQTVISVFTPYGYTPTSHALEQAAKDLGPDGRRTIILVSDGEESCGVDPAATAQRLRGSGIDLTINTVGLHADRATSRQLQQVATAGGGSYTSASSSSELESGLRHILDRMRSGQPPGTDAADTPVGAASTGDPSGQQTPAGARDAQRTGGGLSTGGLAVPALLLVALFFWLKDHK